MRLQAKVSEDIPAEDDLAQEVPKDPLECMESQEDPCFPDHDDDCDNHDAEDQNQDHDDDHVQAIIEKPEARYWKFHAIAYIVI